MNIAKILVFSLFLPFAVLGQTRISGKVTDSRGAGVPGANVGIKGSYDGTSTDNKGEFIFTTSESGKGMLSVTFIGYNTYEKEVELSGKDISLNVTLKEAVSELNTVTITAGAIEASDEKKAVLLRPLDIVTTAGANGDLYGAIQTLPGTQPAAESEGIFVRGGDASEARTIIDGLPVQHPYTSSVPDIAGRGRFSPFLFKNTVFSTGGYSAQYGQAMSSALILESQDISDVVNNSSVFFSTVGIGYGHSHRWKKVSAGVDANYVNLQPYFLLAKQRTDWDRPPQAGGGSFILRYKTSKTGLLKFYGTQSFSDAALYAVIDTSGNRLHFDNKNSNSYVNSTYKEVLGAKWSLFAATSFSYNKDKRLINGFDATSSDNALQGKLMLTHSLGQLSSIRFGTEAQQVTTRGGSVQNAFGGYGGFADTVSENFVATFAEADWFLSNKFVARLGARQEYSVLIGKSNVAPRISLAYKTGKNSQLSFAYGDFYQTPSTYYLTGRNDAGLSYEKAEHYILSYQVITEKRTFRTELYNKNYRGLVKYTIDPFTYRPYGLGNTGSGYARGIDVFWRDKQTLRYVDYWLSYSYVDTRRDYLNYISEAQPTFVADNTFNAVFKRFFIKIMTSVGFTYTYATGRPYFNPNKTTESEFLSDRTPGYHNLSVNASYLTNVKGHFTVVALSVSNALGIDNIFGYRYIGKNIKVPIKSPSPTFVFLGVFISIGKDKYEGID